MENDEKTMTGEESLRIITDMINKTKVSISQGSFHLLFWGWLIFFCSLSEYLLLKFTDFTHPYYIWFFTIPGVIISVSYGIIKGRMERVYTYATSVYVSLWIAFLFSAIILFVLMMDSAGKFGSVILTLAAIPTMVSGIILKFRPLVYGAITFWLFALAGHFGGPDVTGLSMPAAMLTGYLLPGYLLKRRKND